MTHDIGDPHHIEAPPPIPETAADQDPTLHTSPVEQHLLDLHCILTKWH